MRAGERKAFGSVNVISSGVRRQTRRASGAGLFIIDVQILVLEAIPHLSIFCPWVFLSSESWTRRGWSKRVGSYLPAL